MEKATPLTPPSVSMDHPHPRDLAFCGLLGAAALLLPILFHLVHLGPLFMPMYLPLVLLAFFARPLPAAVTALVTPLLSTLLTGMPPLYPPVAVFMSLELGAMGLVIALVRRRWPRCSEWIVLIPVLMGGRLLQMVLVYGCSRVMELPAGFLAGLSFLSGWSGILLMLAVIPSVVRIHRYRGSRVLQEKTHESEGA